MEDNIYNCWCDCNRQINFIDHQIDNIIIIDDDVEIYESIVMINSYNTDIILKNCLKLNSLILSNCHDCRIVVHHDFVIISQYELIGCENSYLCYESKQELDEYV
jgi:hypothetical protein